jgi:FkbM family methyltransferase
MTESGPMQSIFSYSLDDNRGYPIDVKLYNFMKIQKGFYIELGAHDGLFQSNTKMLEETCGWTGILIEPSPVAFRHLQQNRPNNILVNCCCSNYNGITKGDFHGSPMSSIGGTRVKAAYDGPILLDGVPMTEQIDVPVQTLNNILETAGRLVAELASGSNDLQIDLLVIDTEGHELEVLQGLDIQKYKPKFILVEIYPEQYDKIREYLSDYQVVNFSGYNKIDNPGWDGSHNDYLFYK